MDKLIKKIIGLLTASVKPMCYNSDSASEMNKSKGVSDGLGRRI